MSIIFKTLEKLKNDTRQKGSAQLKARKHRNVISLDKIVSSLPWLLVAAVLVFATGATIFYVIKGLAYSASGNQNKTFISVSNPEPSAMDHTNKNSASLHIKAPESSGTEHPESLEDPKYTPRSTRKESSVSGKAPSVQEPASAAYLPPKRHVKREPYQSAMQKQETQQNLPEFKTQIVSDSGEAAPVLDIDEADYLPPVRQDNNNLKVDTVAIYRNVSKPKHVGRQSSGLGYTNSEHSGQTAPQNSLHEKREKSQQEKMRLATVKKNYRICQLVSEAKRSLLSGNDSRTESLLKALSACKGQDDAYVMKLRAFWHLKQEKYESAKSLLDLLLMMDENDLEVGINMAVLEIKTNQLDRAQKRLEKLRQRYADNTQIPSLLWKIRKINRTMGDSYYSERFNTEAAKK